MLWLKGPSNSGRTTQNGSGWFLVLGSCWKLGYSGSSLPEYPEEGFFPVRTEKGSRSMLGCYNVGLRVQECVRMLHSVGLVWLREI